MLQERACIVASCAELTWSVCMSGAGKEQIAAAVAATRREERLAADQRLTQALQSQQQRLQQHFQQQLQQQQQQQSPARRQDSHMSVNLSESSEMQALQQKLTEALARYFPSDRLLSSLLKTWS